MTTIGDVPKAELHCHLEGALHLPTLWEFSQRHEPGRYASFEAFKSAIVIPKESFPGFKAFLSKFDALRFTYGILDDIGRLVYESIYRMGSTVSYREIRFSPVFFARRIVQAPETLATELPVSLVEEVSEVVINQVSKAGQDRGYPIEFIVTCNRGMGYTVNKPTLALLHRPIARRIKGLDLAGDESANASDFVHPFREWKDAGKTITIHAGEAPDAGGPLSVLEALDVFKANRIGHGVRSIEDSSLVARLSEEGIPLEICPTSNVQTRAVASEMLHPMKRLWEAGVCLSINTDDPVICDTTIEDEYAFAARLGFSNDELAQCTRLAIEASVLSDRQRGQWLRKNARENC